MFARKELIFEGSALTSESVEMTCLEPEEFIQKAAPRLYTSSRLATPTRP